MFKLVGFNKRFVLYDYHSMLILRDEIDVEETGWVEKMYEKCEVILENPAIKLTCLADVHMKVKESCPFFVDFHQMMQQPGCKAIILEGLSLLE